MKRVRVLVFSVLFEVVLFAAIYFFLSPVSKFLAGISGIAALTLVGFLLVYFWWAPKNLYFTFVPEGRAKIVVRADAVKKVLIQWGGYSLAQKPDASEQIDVGDVVRDLRRRRRRRFWGGLYYYGFWPPDDIYIYDFSWTNVKEDGTIQKHEKETLDYILLKDDTYLARVLKAEDIELLPLDIGLVLTIRVLNPEKALFKVQNWLETVKNRTEPAVRDIITENSYRDWIEKLEDFSRRIFAALETRGLLSEFRGRYGVDVRAVEVRNIDPPAEYIKATLAKTLAQREAEKITTLADADKKRIMTVYRTVKRYGKTGELIRALEALEKSPEQGAKWIIPIPLGIFSTLFAEQPVNLLSPTDIRRIRTFLQQMESNSTVDRVEGA